MNRYWLVYESHEGIRSLADTPLYNTMQDAWAHAERLKIKHPMFNYSTDYVDIKESELTK